MSISGAVTYLTNPGATAQDSSGWLPPWASYLSGLPRDVRRRRVIVTIQAFVDESGGKGQGPLLVLAALIGQASQWAEFSGQWADALAAPPTIRYFKTREAVGLSGEFGNWTRSSRDRKLQDLIRVLNDFRLTELHVALDLGAFDRTVAAVAAKPLADPYFHAFHMAILAITADLLSTRGQSEPFEIIFDESVIFGPRAKSWYPILREIVDPEFRAILPIDPIFRDDRTDLPLQASDLFAWLFRTELSGSDNPLAWVLAGLHNMTTSPFIQHLRRDRLERIAINSLSGDVEKRLIDKYRELFGP